MLFRYWEISGLVVKFVPTDSLWLVSMLGFLGLFCSNGFSFVSWNSLVIVCSYLFLFALCSLSWTLCIFHSIHFLIIFSFLPIKKKSVSHHLRNYLRLNKVCSPEHCVTLVQWSSQPIRSLHLCLNFWVRS